jgi:SPP1 family predicted phage head-tail adaptor
MTAGKRDRKITFERSSSSVDQYGGETQQWQFFAEAWANIIYGTGQERREAAQESAQVAATFQVLANSDTRDLTTLDRINFDGFWDIVSAVPNRRKFIDITAIRQGG